MEELLHRRFTATEELDVIDKQNIQLTVLLTELRCAVLTERFQKLRQECLTGNVANAQLRVALLNRMADRMQGVCLAIATWTIDKHRVVNLTRRLADRRCTRCRKLVCFSTDKCLKGERTVQVWLDVNRLGCRTGAVCTYIAGCHFRRRTPGLNACWSLAGDGWLGGADNQINADVVDVCVEVVCDELGQQIQMTDTYPLRNKLALHFDVKRNDVIAIG